MPDTRRTLAELLTLYADNVAGDISEQDGRDFIVSVFGGGLETNAQTITTADVTGAVGQLYVCTIAGLTADRNLTLPSATAGERLGVYIVDGDDTYSLILKGAASQTINGGSAATEWSRLFIQGELVIFRCVSANTWVVEIDRRIPSQCRVRLSAAVTTNTAATVKAIGFDTEDYDRGSIYDAVTNKYMTCRRAGVYTFAGFIYPNVALATDSYYGAFLYNDVVASYTKAWTIDARRTPVNSSLTTAAFSAQDTLAVGDKVVPCFYALDTNAGVLHTNASAPHKWQTYFAATEVF